MEIKGMEAWISKDILRFASGVKIPSSSVHTHVLFTPERISKLCVNGEYKANS